MPPPFCERRRPWPAPVLAGAWGEHPAYPTHPIDGGSPPHLKGYEDYVSVSYNSSQPIVGIVMGSDSNRSVMEAAAEFWTVHPYEADVVSAHRMPEDMIEYGKKGSQPRY